MKLNRGILYHIAIALLITFSVTMLSLTILILTHTINLNFFIDGQNNIGDPEALEGNINYLVWYTGYLFN